MSLPPVLDVRVVDIEQLTPAVKRFALAPCEGQALPGFSAGSHIMVHLPGAACIHRNSYSLVNAPADRGTYRIAVKRLEDSRGGSAYMHERVKPGDVLQISPPANLFPLDRLAARHLLIAGGIGITPFMSHVEELAGQSAPFALHYAYRGRGHAAFREGLAAKLGERLHEYDSAAGQRLDLRALLAGQPLGTHVYVCGPERLAKAAMETAVELGWPNSQVHYEQFAAPQPGRPFKVSCARSGREIDVPVDMSLLEALETAGVDVPNMCRSGLCGQCETDLLEGQAEHRDSYLPSELREKKIMPCVSRARGERLVLDL